MKMVKVQEFYKEVFGLELSEEEAKMIDVINLIVALEYMSKDPSIDFESKLKALKIFAGVVNNAKMGVESFLTYASGVCAMGSVNVANNIHSVGLRAIKN